MERIGVYAGSFDPVTVGHEDVIRRAAQLFDRLIVCVMHNPAKKGCFPVEERIAMLEKTVAELPNVSVDKWDGLLVDYLRLQGAKASVRGLRGVSDFESEMHMAQVNAQLMPGMETVFLMTRPEHGQISSSVVREAASFGADVRPFLPEVIAEEAAAALREKCGEKS